jgi:hypothetical protein
MHTPELSLCFWREGETKKFLLLSDIFEHHVDVHVKPSQSAYELLVTLHDDPYLRSDTSVNQLCSQPTDRPPHDTV